MESEIIKSGIVKREIVEREIIEREIIEREIVEREIVKRERVKREIVKGNRKTAEPGLPPRIPTEPLTADEIRALADQALKVLPGRTAYFAALVGVTYGRITIRNQKTRWGSCSSKGNLNFNCLLMLAPASIQDYVVVHELCHRKEMNHSRRFWAEVEKILPDYRERERWLKEYGPVLMDRMLRGM